MLLKEYFTDGLLQVAIVLSLLRTDFDLYFGTRYQDQWRRSELQEILQGPHVGYTQTDFHTRTGWQASHLYSKHIDFIRTEEVLRDLHSLGDYRRFDGVQTNIATWLVNGPEPLVAQPPVATQNEGDARTGQAELESHNQTNEDIPSVDPAVPNYSAYFGTELTKEDMDLIDILWRQDIDLGIGREMFDSSRRQEKEIKDKPINETEVEQHQDVQNVTINPASALVNQSNYAIDNETGELIPVQAPNITADDVLELLQQINNTDSIQGNDLVPVKNFTNHNDSFDDFFEEYGVQTVEGFDDVEASVKLEEEPSGAELLAGVGEGEEESWEDVLSLLQEQSLLSSEEFSRYINNQSSQPISRQDSLMSLDLLNITSTAASSVEDLAYRNPILFNDEQQSADLWNSSLSSDDQFLVNNVSLAQTVSMPYTTAALLNNSFTSAFNNFTTRPDLSVQTQGSVSNLTNTTTHGLSPIFSVGQSSAPFSNLTALLTDSYTSDSAAAGVTHQMSAETARLPMLNLSQPMTIAPYNNNDTFIQQFLQNHDLADLTFDDNIDEDTGVALDYDGLHESWSTDSAVSSMHSPNCQMQGACSGSSYAGSLDGMEELEGATGGSSKEEMKYSDMLYYRSYDANSRRLQSFSSNTSLSTNSSHHEYDESAKPYQKHITHNHTYYLQPGQKSREEKEAEARREKEERATRCKDAKRAEMLKIPFCVEDIIDLPVDQFTELLSRYTLTEAQHQLIRDIRRRGKNKAAAQNCRKRKLEVIQTLEDEVEGLRLERDKLHQNKMKLNSETMVMKEKFARLQADILRSLRDPNGRPYNPDEYTLQRTSDGDIILVPRSRSAASAARRGNLPQSGLPEDRENQKRKPKRKE